MISLVDPVMATCCVQYSHYADNICTGVIAIVIILAVQKMMIIVDSWSFVLIVLLIFVAVLMMDINDWCDWFLNICSCFRIYYFGACCVTFSINNRDFSYSMHTFFQILISVIFFILTLSIVFICKSWVTFSSYLYIVCIVSNSQVQQTNSRFCRNEIF